MTSEYSAAELMAVVLARELKDGDFTGRGSASEIPACAIPLAVRTHAPNLWYLYGGSGALNSKARQLSDSTGDFRNLEGAEYRAPLGDIIDFEFTGRFTVGFFGGMQVDQYGNINMVCIGDYDKMKVRGPGAVGSPFTASIKRIVYYFERHTTRVFVPRVDFISGPGHAQTRGSAANRIPGVEGPVALVSPLCVMDFDTPDKRMAIRSVHPGVTVEDVVKNTGFELVIPKNVPTTEPPTHEEMTIIREEIDPAGILRNLIS
jgi:glutaconate CoA-transferase subunit B